jgi:phospholipase C
MFVAILSAGCSLAAVGPVAQKPAPPTQQMSGLIKHVVIIVQENRTVDNLFNGFPGADTVTSGKTHTGAMVPLQPVSLANETDICHAHPCWLQSYDGGKLDGFDLNSPSKMPATYPYAYVPRSETIPYWTMAKSFAFADRMFQSNSGPSFPAHMYLIAGQSQMASENPGGPVWGCDAQPGTTVAVLGSNGQEHTGPFPCFLMPTLADEMDHSGISWRYYAPQLNWGGSIWSAFDAIKQIRNSPDWANNIVSPETQVLSDVAAGKLAAVTWVTPSGLDSDHPVFTTTGGPAWVASVVNTIGQSQYWNSTAIFITWDDWGGWYDHVTPPQLDQMGLGYRVPLIVVSPYAKTGYVSHRQHEFGSILKFAEETFGLGSLGGDDARSDDLTDCFDFTQKPLTFSPVPSNIPASYFIHRAPDRTPPDSD